MPNRPPTHRAQPRPANTDGRPSASRRGYGRRWRKAQQIKLARDPLCSVCGKAASEVDHLDGNARNSAWENLDSKCKPCHSRKTVREDGGLGR